MKQILVLILLLPCSLFAQTRNYDQELTNILFANQIEEANSYYNQYKDSIFHPFVRDSYQLIAAIHAGELESVLTQFPVFIDNYYGDLLQDDLLFYLPSLYVNGGKYASGLKMLDSIETFFRRRQSEGIDSEKALKETEKQKQQYMVWIRFPQLEYSSPDFVLADLLFKKQIVEAQEHYALHRDSIVHPFALDSYRLITAIYADKPDSVLLLLPAFIDKYHGTLIPDDVLLHLPSFYWDLGEYDNGLNVLDAIETVIRKKQNGEENREEILTEIAKLKHRYTTYSLLPKFEIEAPENTERIQVAMQTEPLILFDAQYNNTTLSTVFDTGSGYPFFTNKKNAEKSGIKLIEPFSYQYLNGEKISLAYGMIDSIRIGSLLIKNALVVITEENRHFEKCVPDSVQNKEEAFAKIDSIYDLLEIVLGLPIIKVLNYIQLDIPNNTLTFSPNRKNTAELRKKSNMFMESGSLYLQTEINGLNFIAFMDTGGDLGETSVLIGEQFYWNHLKHIPSDVFKEKGIQPSCEKNLLNHLASFSPDVLTMKLENHVFDLANETMILMADSKSPSIKDGFIGLGLFKKMERVTFDFDAMRMD